MSIERESVEVSSERRLRLVDMLITDRQFTVKAMSDSLYQALTHYYHLMVLQAGIVGLVIPVLNAQAPSLFDPWFLRRSVSWFGVSLLVGVLIAAMSRWLLMLVLVKVQKQVLAQNEAIANSPDEESVGVSISKVNAEFVPALMKLQRNIYVLNGIGDLLFYGGFLGGIAHLLIAFL